MIPFHESRITLQCTTDFLTHRSEVLTLPHKCPIQRRPPSASTFQLCCVQASAGRSCSAISTID